MTLAICRAVSPSFARCELTHIDRVPIDVDLARVQHRQYEQTLEQLGARIVSLAADADLPDSVFVEDTAVVLDEVAVIMRPGAVSRRAEVQTIAKTLAAFRPLVFITEPATIDGGDVLLIGKTLYVGLSTRSDAAGVEALANAVKPYGYQVRGVTLSGCLHLKSAATLITSDKLVVNPAWVDPSAFDGVSFMAVDPDEPHGANALRIGSSLVYASAYPRTRDRMAKFVTDIHTVDLSELAKAEGAVTCCSLVVE